MIIRVIDCETTGLDPIEDRVVEIGCVDLNENGAFEGVMQTLVNPLRDIPPKASAIHHITTAMIEEDMSPTYGEAILGFHGANYYVAHNSRFDQQFLTVNGPWIDTYRCSVIAWPDAPGHGNQVLSYFLDLPRPPEDCGHAHRALYDAWTTAFLFQRLMDRFSIDEMLEISSRPALLPRINFGKHAGTAFGDLDGGYLTWMSNQDFDEDIMFTVAHEIRRRRQTP